MNLIKRIKEKNDLNSQFKTTSILALDYLKSSCVDLDKILKSIHSLEEFYSTNETLKNKEEIYTKRLICNLYDFEYNFTKFNHELIYLNSLSEKMKLTKKQIKTLARLTDANKTQEHNFLETYSKFLVKCQICFENKQKIKENYIIVIKDLKIPLHTDEIKNNCN